MKGRRERAGRDEGVVRVSIHAPVKGRRPRMHTNRSMLRCFNPRPREGATWQEIVPAECPDVSIHAPVKGRQISFPEKREDFRVSIHAPVKGRRGKGNSSAAAKSFNPRPREGATMF